ncbi:MAG TPA: hypothetical protein VMT18_12830 [Planctomycetota bacterium]|nr:hypothetical protein [Planctomycetota bacterium]
MRTITSAGLLTLSLVAPSVLLAAPLRAGGYDSSRVPSDAVIVAHLDVEALVRSQVWAELQRQHPEVSLQLDLGKHHPMLAGIQPLRDVRSVTVFTSDAGKERFAALLHVDARLEAALQVAVGLEQYEALEVNGRSIHSWSDGDSDRVFAYVQPVGDDRLVLVSNDTALLGKGLAALTSGGASLAQSSHAVLRAPAQPGAILYGASAEPLTKLGDVDASSSVAQLVQGAVVQLGEVGGAVFGNVSLITDKPEDALRLSQVLQGLSALASLAAENVEQAQAVQRLVGGLSFQANGSQLYVEFRYDLASLIRELKSLEDMH